MDSAECAEFFWSLRAIDGRGPRKSDMKLESRTSTLQDLYAEESARIQKRFEESGDGKAAIRDRSALIDSVVTELWNEVTAASGPIEGFCIAAMGGYGRRALFPYSDIDLLFLYGKEGREEFLSKKIIAPLSQSLWDLHLRVSPTTRTLAECGKLHRSNIEFNISLLDCRYICGDEKLYERLRTRVLPGHGDARIRNLDAGTHRPGPLAASRNTAKRFFTSNPTSRMVPAACGTIKWLAGSRKSRK